MSFEYDVNGDADKIFNAYYGKETVEKKEPIRKDDAEKEVQKEPVETDIPKDDLKEEVQIEKAEALDKEATATPDMQRGGSEGGSGNNDSVPNDKEEKPDDDVEEVSNYEDEKNIVEVDTSESVKSVTETSTKSTDNSVLAKAPEKPKIVSESLKPVRYYTGDSVITVTEFVDTRSKAETRGVTSSSDDKARQVYVSGRLLDEICDFLKCGDISASLLVNAILHYFIKSKLPINESCHDILKTVFNSKDDDMLKKVSESMDKVQKTVTTMRSESEDLIYGVLQAVVLMYLTYMGREKEDNTDVRKFISMAVDMSTSGQFRHMVEQLSLSGLGYGQMARSRKYSNKTIAKEE
jgi:hypothetical protein